MTSYQTRAKRIREAALGTPEPTPPVSAGPAAVGTEARPETEKKQNTLRAEVDGLRRTRAALDQQLATQLAADDRARFVEQLRRVNIELAQKLDALGLVNEQAADEDRALLAAGQASESIDLGETKTSAFSARRPEANRPVPGTQFTSAIAGVLAPGETVAARPEDPEPKRPRFNQLGDVPQLLDYATFLNVLRSRVKLLSNLVDDADLAFAGDAWRGRKYGKNLEFDHPVVLEGVKLGRPYRTVRLWLEQYRLFPDVLSSAFVSVLSSIEALRRQQNKEPIPFWDLVREPHLSTFAKWIGHQHLHDQQLANQWGGRSEGHIALAMSTRDALSYFEALP